MIPLQGANLTNASSSFASSSGLSGMLVVIVALVIVAFFAVIGSARVYQWMLNATGYFAQSVAYALMGVITAMFIAAFAVPIYLLSQLDGEARALLGYAIAVAIGGYVVLVLLGMVGNVVWQLIKRRHVEATGHEPFANLGEDADE